MLFDPVQLIYACSTVVGAKLWQQYTRGSWVFNSICFKTRGSTDKYQ